MRELAAFRVIDLAIITHLPFVHPFFILPQAAISLPGAVWRQTPGDSCCQRYFLKQDTG
jgi:hypothetical protein